MQTTADMIMSLRDYFGDEIVEDDALGKSLVELFIEYIDDGFITHHLPCLISDLPISEEELWEIIDQLHTDYGPDDDIKPPSRKEILSRNDLEMELKVEEAACFYTLYLQYIQARNNNDGVMPPEDTVLENLGSFVDCLIQWQVVIHPVTDEVLETGISLYRQYGELVIRDLEHYLDEKVKTDRPMKIQLSF